MPITDRCSVCLRRLLNGQKVAETNCEHLFHVICIEKVVKTGKKIKLFKILL